MSLLNRQTNASARDNELLLQNDRIGKASQKRDQKVKPPLNTITEEMIREYKEQFPNKFEFESVDEEGTPIKEYRQFITPEVIPTLDEIEELPSRDLFESRVVEQYRRSKRDLEEQARELNRYIKDNHKEQEQLDKAVNRGSIRPVDYMNEKERLFAQLEELTAEYTAIQAQADNVNAHIDIMHSRYDELEKGNADIKRRNLDKVEAYKNTLNILNKGAFQTQKGLNETEEEYLERLRQNAEILAPEEEEQDATFYMLRRFKDKLKEIIRNPVQIEEIANTFTPTDKTSIVKQFPLVKKTFSNIYGINPKIKTGELITFLNQFTEQGESGLSVAIEHELKQEHAPGGGDFSVPTEGVITIDADQPNDRAIIKRANHPILFLKVIIPASISLANAPYMEMSNIVLVYSYTGEKGTYKQWFKSRNVSQKDNYPVDRLAERDGITVEQEIEDKIGLTMNDLKKIKQLNTTNIELLAKKLMNPPFSIRPLRVGDPTIIEVGQYRTPGGKKAFTEYGYGIHAEKIPEIAHFGKILILPQKLYYHNILAVKTIHKKGIAGLPNTKVSEKFVKIILNMLENIHPTHEELHRLSTTERQLYDRLIHLASLQKIMPHQSNRTIDDLKKRMKLVEGEIEIGNNNPMLEKELYQIVHTLRNMGVISHKDGVGYLAQFKTGKSIGSGKSCCGKTKCKCGGSIKVQYVGGVPHCPPMTRMQNDQWGYPSTCI